jgi:hypothetical protein
MHGQRRRQSHTGASTGAVAVAVVVAAAGVGSSVVATGRGGREA